MGQLALQRLQPLASLPRRPPSLPPPSSATPSLPCATASRRPRFYVARAMSSHIVGYPRIGPKRELKFALESFWDGKTNVDDLQNVAANLRKSIWKHMAHAGIKYIPSNTFSYYDQMLDTTAMLGAVPSRYGWESGEIGFDVYFSMARGNASAHAMEMTKWFDTNYHYIVPELGPDVNFSYASHKAVVEFKEAKALGIDTVPVLIGPMTYLLLSKPAKGVEKSFCLLSLIDKILPVYKEVLADLKSAGARWIQFDEPILVLQYCWSNVCLHMFTLDFLNQVANGLEKDSVYHLAEKKIPSINGDIVGLKLEQFIFDCFPYAPSTALFEVLREEEFAPVKNANGSNYDTPESARLLVLRLHTRWVIAAGGFLTHSVPLYATGVEVSPLCSYAGENLEAICRGRTFHAPCEISL